MKIGVTGGSGFVGKKLIETLTKMQSIEINALSRKARNSDCINVDWYLGDLNSPESLRDFLAGCDIVCNCAGELTESKKFHANNVRGVASLYNASVDAGVGMFIQLSSAGIYDELACGEINEESELSACNDYELSKINAEKLLFKEKEIKTIILRPTTVYGVDMPNQSLKSLFGAIRSNKFFFIGHKNAISCYISVENLVDAIVRVIRDKEGICTEKANNCIAYNVADDMLYTDFLDLVAQALSVSLPRLRLPIWLVLLILKINALTIGLLLPLTRERVLVLSRRSTFSSKKFVSRFPGDYSYPHAETVKHCAESWFADAQ